MKRILLMHLCLFILGQTQAVAHEWKISFKIYG